jgi:hypothetical protein
VEKNGTLTVVDFSTSCSKSASVTAVVFDIVAAPVRRRRGTASGISIQRRRTITPTHSP